MSTVELIVQNYGIFLLVLCILLCACNYMYSLHRQESLQEEVEDELYSIDEQIVIVLD